MQLTCVNWRTSRELRSFTLQCSIYKRPIKQRRLPRFLQESIKLFNPYYLLFLPAISGLSRIPGVLSSVNRKLIADFRHSPVSGIPGARAGHPEPPNHKFPEKWYSSREFGSSALDQGPVRPVSTGYPH